MFLALPYEGMSALFVRYIPEERRVHGLDCEIVVDGDVDTITPYRSDNLEFDREYIAEISEREGTADHVVGSTLVLYMRRKRLRKALWDEAKKLYEEALPFERFDPELVKDLRVIALESRKKYIAAIHEMDEWCTTPQG